MENQQNDIHCVPTTMTVFLRCTLLVSDAITAGALQRCLAVGFCCGHHQVGLSVRILYIIYIFIDGYICTCCLFYCVVLYLMHLLFFN